MACVLPFIAWPCCQPGGTPFHGSDPAAAVVGLIELCFRVRPAAGPVGGKLLAAVSICRRGGNQTCNPGSQGFPLESAAGK